MSAAYRGISLIEVLGIVLVVVVLAVIVWPMIPSRHSRDGRFVRCMGNQKQIACGMFLYAGDNKETMPPADGWPSAIRFDAYTLSCPYAPAVPLAYVYNAALGGKKLDSIPGNPERTLVTTDGQNPARPGVWENESHTDWTRHNGRTMRSFLDGHVEAVRQP